MYSIQLKNKWYYAGFFWYNYPVFYLEEGLKTTLENCKSILRNLELKEDLKIVEVKS